MAGHSKVVHHVVWCVHPESLGRVRELWQDGLGVELQEVDLPEHGVVVLISWEGGVEVIAPVHADGELAAAARAFLAEHGEGVFSVVYAVDDIDAAVERVLALGGELVFRDDITVEQFEERQVGGPGARPQALRQALFAPIGGMRLCLQQEDDAG